MASKGMRDITLNLQGGVPQTVKAAGDYIHVQVATGAVQLSFDSGPAITRFQGQGNRVIYNDDVVVASATTQTVTLQIGYGYATDSRATFGGTINVTDSPAVNNPARAAVSCTAGAQTQLWVGDANALEQLIEIPSTAAGGLWIGDNTAAVNVGLFVEPGMVVGIPTTAAGFAWNPNGVAVVVTRLTLRNI